MPGWHGTTFGVTDFAAMPAAAKAYVAGLEALVGAPIDIVSTGPDREQTIIVNTPFGVS